MSDDRKTGLYSGLEKLTTEELEELLRSDLITPEGEDPDVDYIMAITEVIEKREQAAPGWQPPDIDAAWKRFQEEYQGQDPIYTDEVPDEPISSHSQASMETPKPVRRRLKFRTILAAAVIVVFLAGTAASAFGVNIFQALAYITEETLGFTVPWGDGTIFGQVDPCQEMRKEVEELTDTPAMPNWYPEGTELVELRMQDRNESKCIYALCEAGEFEFDITIVVYNSVPEDLLGKYEKDTGEDKKTYESGGITHYIMDNIGNRSIAWNNGVIEGCIRGNIPIEELKRMVDSIYEV